MSLNSKMYSVTHFKCPKCHQGDLYPTKIHSFKGWFTMNNHCDHCGQKYNLEPGFYWGAMYIAYMVSSFFIFAFFALYFFVLNITVSYAFILSLASLILLYPFIFRTARAIWINIYVHYSPEAARTK